MKVALLVTVLVAGCGAMQSDGDPSGVVHGVTLAEVPAPAAADPATKVIVSAYERILGFDMTGVPLRIRWTASMPDDLLGDTAHGSFGCDTWILAGSMFAYPKVLPHEIGHCVHWLMTGDGDHEHSDPAWWGRGGLVDQAHAAEAAAGY